MERINNLDDYVTHIKKSISTLNLTEEELIMYVYLDLGYQLHFDNDFFFARSKKKILYFNAKSINELNRCFREKKITCVSASYMLEYILKRLNVNIKTTNDADDLRKYKHVYNVIYPKDGSKPYTIDLQDDIINIHFRAKTRSFGLDLYDDKIYNVSLIKQKQIHKKLHYISQTDLYTDDYVYLLKSYLPMFGSIEKQIDFVLMNIDSMPFEKVSYLERRWMHERILNFLFTAKELSNHLHTIEFFHKEENGERIFINGFFMNAFVYLYSSEHNCYIKYSIKDFALKSLEEEIGYRQKIFGINKELRLIKQKRINN